MHFSAQRVIVTQVAYILIAAAVLVNSGCLLVAAGACAGGAAGYVYFKGKVCENYVADFGDAWAATHTALHELGMPIEKEDRDGMTGVIHTHTTTGESVLVDLETTISPIPAQGSITRVGVRVATFGNYDISEQLLHQVSGHLVTAPAGVNPQVPPPGAPVPVPPPPPGPSSTAPPPLAPPQPIVPQPAGKP